MADKKYFTYFCDDTVRFLEQINRDHPASVFDNEFLGKHKALHDKYGFKVQFNLFFENLSGSFNLGMMTADYKEEFEANSDWLAFGFHARREFPDFPYVNATYDEVALDFEDVSNNIVRFAGKKCLTDSNVNHWVTMTKEGIQALVDHGVKMVTCTSGQKDERPEAKCALSSDHIKRLLATKEGASKPSVAHMFVNETSSLPYLVNHNNIDPAISSEYRGKTKFYRDPETGMLFNHYADVTLNACPLDEVESAIRDRLAGYELIIPIMHEQYFYSDYYSYEPDYFDKIELAVKTLQELGYEMIAMRDLPGFAE